MATETPEIAKSEPGARGTPGSQVPFGVNAMRLNARQWAITAAIILACAVGTPRVWKRIERFDTPADYRIP